MGWRERGRGLVITKYLGVKQFYIEQAFSK